jgi:hypothetical protein
MDFMSVSLVEWDAGRIQLSFMDGDSNENIMSDVNCCVGHPEKHRSLA